MTSSSEPQEKSEAKLSSYLVKMKILKQTEPSIGIICSILDVCTKRRDSEAFDLKTSYVAEKYMNGKLLTVAQTLHWKLYGLGNLATSRKSYEQKQNSFDKKYKAQFNVGLQKWITE